MKTIRTAVATAALVAVLAGCGTPVAGTPAAQPAPPPTAPPDPAVDQQAIEKVFSDYYSALQAQDFAAACGYNAPETTAKLLANLRARGVEADTCEEGMTAVYAVPDTARVVEQVAETASIQGVTVTGDLATLSWSSTVNGKRSPATTQLRRVDGRWLVAGSGT